MLRTLQAIARSQKQAHRHRGLTMNDQNGIEELTMLLTGFEVVTPILNTSGVFEHLC